MGYTPIEAPLSVGQIVDRAGAPVGRDGHLQHVAQVDQVAQQHRGVLEAQLLDTRGRQRALLVRNVIRKRWCIL